jgi:hypothetical protein
MKRLEFEPGRRFGMLTVVGPALSRQQPNGRIRGYTACRCDCGTLREVISWELGAGIQKSCGCQRGKNFAQACKRAEPRGWRRTFPGPATPASLLPENLPKRPPGGRP